MTPYALGDRDLASFGRLDRQRWERNLATYQRIGILSRNMHFDEIVDDRFDDYLYP